MKLERKRMSLISNNAPKPIVVAVGIFAIGIACYRCFVSAGRVVCLDVRDPRNTYATNEVVRCITDNEHPFVILLGFNKKILLYPRDDALIVGLVVNLASNAVPVLVESSNGVEVRMPQVIGALNRDMIYMDLSAVKSKTRHLVRILNGTDKTLLCEIIIQPEV